MKKLLVGILGTLVIVFVVAAPVITALQMKSAAENGNGEALSEHIEFPDLRQNMKDQLNVSMAQKMDKMAEENPFAALGAAMLPMIVDGMIDAYVTPTGISAMMQGEQVSNGEAGEGASNKNEVFRNASMSYKSLNTFVITVPNDQGEKTDFILSRKGLGWKLTNIIIPLR